jgi:hypothetical protein
MLWFSKVRDSWWNSISFRTYPFFEDIISYPYPDPKKDIISYHYHGKKGYVYISYHGRNGSAKAKILASET